MADRTKDYEKYKDKLRANQRRYVERNRQYVYKLLRDAACVDCGETHPLVLEFDHIGDNKKRGISFMVSRGYAIKTIQEEIDKCEIVCRNCHSKRTHAREQTYRWDYWILT